MIRNDDLNRLESHWAVVSIPEEERQACFHKIEEIHVKKSVGNSINLV